MFSVNLPDKQNESLQQHLEMVRAVRVRVAHKSNATNQRMIRRHGSQLPHSMYAIGDEVLVKTHKKKWNKIKGKGITTKRSSKGVVVAANVAFNKYKVKLDNSPNEMWVSVNSLTSLTRKKEKNREKVSGMLSLLAGITYS